MENVPPNIFNIVLVDLPANWIKLSWRISQKEEEKKNVMKENSMSLGFYQN